MNAHIASTVLSANALNMALSSEEEETYREVAVYYRYILAIRVPMDRLSVCSLQRKVLAPISGTPSAADREVE